MTSPLSAAHDDDRFAKIARRFLPDALLERIRGRADDLDRENEFCHEDLADLKAHGYLVANVPAEFGGPGLTLSDVARLQQRLAGANPSTALAVNMHLMTLGVVQAMFARGDNRLSYVFEEALAGEIFAFGVSEPANDLVLYGSNTAAVPDGAGGYLLSGVKIFTSLAPVWTRLITHGLDSSDPNKPQLVYGFVERDAGGVTIPESWDVMGMRATHSKGTLLHDTPMRADRVIDSFSPGPGFHLITFCITAHFQLLIASVYAGVAQRAIELAATGLKERKSTKADSSYADIPEFRARLGQAVINFLPVPAQIDAYTRDFDDLIDLGSGWSPRLVSARLAASNAAISATETAMHCSGGRSFSNGSEISRLHRDAMASLFHPPSVDAAIPMYASWALDESPTDPSRASTHRFGPEDSTACESD